MATSSIIAKKNAPRRAVRKSRDQNKYLRIASIFCLLMIYIGEARDPSVRYAFVHVNGRRRYRAGIKIEIKTDPPWIVSCFVWDTPRSRIRAFVYLPFCAFERVCRAKPRENRRYLAAAVSPGSSR